MDRTALRQHFAHQHTHCQEMAEFYRALAARSRTHHTATWARFADRYARGASLAATLRDAS